MFAILFSSNVKNLNFSNDFSLSLGANDTIINIDNSKIYSLESLSNVNIQNISSEDLLVYNLSTNLWENKPLSSSLIKDLSIFQLRNLSNVSLSTSWTNLQLPNIDVSNDENTLSIDGTDNTKILIKKSGYYNKYYNSFKLEKIIEFRH